MTRPFMASLALMGLALSAPASGQQGLVTGFDEAILVTAVTSSGGAMGDVSTQDGKSYYQVTLRSGVPAVAYLEDCEGAACKSLVLVSSLPMPEGRTVEEVDQLLRSVNNSVPAAKVYRLSDRVVMQEYILADHGITIGNLQEQLSVFSNVIASMYQTLNSAPGN